MVHHPDEINATEISLGRQSSQPPASPSFRLYEPEAIGPPPRWENAEKVLIQLIIMFRVLSWVWWL